jgi:hypothetical protein
MLPTGRCSFVLKDGSRCPKEASGEWDVFADAEPYLRRLQVQLCDLHAALFGDTE